MVAVASTASLEFPSEELELEAEEEGSATVEDEEEDVVTVDSTASSVLTLGSSFSSGFPSVGNPCK